MAANDGYLRTVPSDADVDDGRLYDPTVPDGGSAINYTLVCDVGSYAYTGQAATLTLARRLALDVGAYTYTGQAAALTVSRNLSLAAGAYAYAGQAATFSIGVGLPLATGAYSYVGSGMSFDYGLIGGAGYPVWRKIPKKSASNDLEKLWKLVASEYYGQIIESDAPQEAKKAAASIVKPFAEKQGKFKSVPKPAEIDWAALERDAEKVSALLKLWQEQVEQRNDDDALAILLLMS